MKKMRMNKRGNLIYDNPISAIMVGLFLILILIFAWKGIGWGSNVTTNYLPNDLTIKAGACITHLKSGEFLSSTFCSYKKVDSGEEKYLNCKYEGLEKYYLDAYETESEGREVLEGVKLKTCSQSPTKFCEQLRNELLEKYKPENILVNGKTCGALGVPALAKGECNIKEGLSEEMQLKAKEICKTILRKDECNTRIYSADNLNGTICIWVSN